MEDESEEEKWAPKKKKAGLLIKEALEEMKEETSVLREEAQSNSSTLEEYYIYATCRCTRLIKWKHFRARLAIMFWTCDHEAILCREVVNVNPYTTKKGSTKRSSMWENIADTLNKCAVPKFRVDKRSFRDHV
ncbi:hypothetical protein P5673_027566 [Acropora cervicornis]|uniref:Uncharacterized protein n=1 Tax=Acropora cervicornis TaxID=6130 RepID=A0AAD9PZ98_ACRCE|nr:hypothetical protein P5673_027566 [Acropora cervicornis]